jgi:hypothetical protein
MADQQLQLIIKYLEGLSDEFSELRQGIQKAIRIASDDPEMALTRARKVLEYIARDIFERRCHEDPGTRPLENLLQRLVKDGHLPKRLGAYANHIRELGNVGTHAHGEKVTVRDVQTSLQELMEIVEWYFEQLRAEEGSKPKPDPEPEEDDKHRLKAEEERRPAAEAEAKHKAEEEAGRKAEEERARRLKEEERLRRQRHMPKLVPISLALVLVAGLAVYLFFKPPTPPTPPKTDLGGTVWRGTYSGKEKPEQVVIEFKKDGQITTTLTKPSLITGTTSPEAWLGTWAQDGDNVRADFPSNMFRNVQKSDLRSLEGKIEGDEIKGNLLFLAVFDTQFFIVHRDK